MRFFRTVLGDLPISAMGICYSHEHIIIDNRFIRANYPELVLASTDKACEELSSLRQYGVQTMVDSMPMAAGRDVVKLAEISRRAGMNILCPTGLHLAQYYPSDHWSVVASHDELVKRFETDITVGVDEFDENGIIEKRTPHRAGVIKVAGGRDKLSPAERRNFQAASEAHRRTGCPILTHTEQGTAALEQVEIFSANGVDLGHVVLSHLDKNLDTGYHREVLGTGVKVEFDSGFRWKEGENHTLRLLAKLAPEFPHSIVLGMDAAKSSYWASYGGKPGLVFLIRDFHKELLKAGLPQDLLDNLFIHNPAAAYAFAEPKRASKGQP